MTWATLSGSHRPYLFLVSCSGFLSTLHLIMAPNYGPSYISVDSITDHTINLHVLYHPQVAGMIEHFNEQLKDKLKWLMREVKIIPALTTNLRQSAWGLKEAIPWKGISHLLHMIHQDIWPLPSIVHYSFTIIDSSVSVGKPARTLHWPLPEDSNQWDIAIIQWGVPDSNLWLHLPTMCRRLIFAKQGLRK